MNLKKILALLLAAVMVCGMLAGCGPKETSNPSNPRYVGRMRPQ